MVTYGLFDYNNATMPGHDQADTSIPAEADKLYLEEALKTSISAGLAHQ